MFKKIYENRHIIGVCISFIFLFCGIIFQFAPIAYIGLCIYAFITIDYKDMRIQDLEDEIELLNKENDELVEEIRKLKGIN